MEIPETKRFNRKGFELGTTLSLPIWSIVYFPAKLGLNIDTFLTLNLGKSYSWVMESLKFMLLTERGDR